jgi:hypothetical protein
MSVVEAPREQELVRGTVQSVVTKGPDKWQIAVVPEGSQYAKNIWCKDAAVINDMTQRIGQAFDFLCNVSHWNMQDGTPVRSLWFDTIGFFGSLAAPAAVAPPPQTPQAAPPQPQGLPGQPSPAPAPQPASAPQAQPQMPQGSLAPQRLPDEVKELRIMRQTATKVAGILLPYLPQEERNLDGFIEMAEWLVRYYTGGPQSRPQAPPPQQDGMQYADPGPQEGQYESYEGGFPQ